MSYSENCSECGKYDCTCGRKYPKKKIISHKEDDSWGGIF